MKFFALFPAKFSDLIGRTLKITQNTRRRGRSLRQCAQFRVFCSAACKTCACCGQMCGLGGRFFCPAASRDGFLQEAEKKAAEKGSPSRGAGAKRLRGCCRFAATSPSRLRRATSPGRGGLGERTPMASPMRGSCRRGRLMRWTAARRRKCPTSSVTALPCRLPLVGEGMELRPRKKSALPGREGRWGWERTRYRGSCTCCGG